MTEKYQLPPGKWHQWKVSVGGKPKGTLYAPSRYYAHEKAMVKHKVEAGQLEIVLVEGKCRKRGHPSNWIRPDKRQRIYKRDNNTCVYCETQLDSPRQLTLEHVVPRSNGQNNHHTNLVTACRSCNSSRQNKTLKAWCLQKKLDYQAITKRIRNAVRRKLPA